MCFILGRIVTFSWGFLGKNHLKRNSFSSRDHLFIITNTFSLECFLLLFLRINYYAKVLIALNDNKSEQFPLDFPLGTSVVLDTIALLIWNKMANHKLKYMSKIK